ncbi:hypothetical protein PROFUN_15955 [Planoprotostelium fungivorum]|uniref:Uncharacterized protein n=1 Tax=Planoprotostelium fungivorum TaxID=1890364 RepID=A0A2P6MTZ2_9EUKA|nr:hypothetical protein PROFUN_15955 [Planoprotostelium fungivorum]
MSKLRWAYLAKLSCICEGKEWQEMHRYNLFLISQQHWFGDAIQNVVKLLPLLCNKITNSEQTKLPTTLLKEVSRQESSSLMKLQKLSASVPHMSPHGTVQAYQAAIMQHWTIEKKQECIGICKCQSGSN